MGKRRKTGPKTTQDSNAEPIPSLGERVAAIRRTRNLTQEDLAEAAGISLRTVGDLERGKRKRFSETTLVRIARALGVSAPELLNPKARTPDKALDDAPRVQPVALSGSPFNFEELLRFAHELDGYLIQVVRSHRDPDYELLSTEYRDLLNARMPKHGLTIQAFLRLLENRTTMRNALLELPDSDLEISINKNFESLTFTYDNEKLRIDKPQLLWDCPCYTPQQNTKTTLRKSQAKKDSSCPIHSHPKGVHVDARFGAGLVLLKWRKAQFYWRCGAELWPPSVDAFHMLRTLESAGIFRREIESVLDLGCGVGFLGILIALNNPHVTRLDLADWLMTPLLYSLLNWQLNGSRLGHIQVNPKLGLFTDWTTTEHVPRTHYDLVVCNPPYLPILPGHESLARSSTVAGTDLLVRLIKQSKAIGNEVYVQFSNLAWPEAKVAAKIAGVELHPVNKFVEVPFRVPLAFSDAAYMQALLEQRDLIERPHERHRYWHTIQTFRVN